MCCWVLDPPDNVVKSCTLSMPDSSWLVDGLLHSVDSKLQVLMGVLVVLDATNGLHSGLLKQATVNFPTSCSSPTVVMGSTELE